MLKVNKHYQFIQQNILCCLTWPALQPQQCMSIIDYASAILPPWLSSTKPAPNSVSSPLFSSLCTYLPNNLIDVLLWLACLFFHQTISFRSVFCARAHVNGEWEKIFNPVLVIKKRKIKLDAKWKPLIITANIYWALITSHTLLKRFGYFTPFYRLTILRHWVEKLSQI